MSFDQSGGAMTRRNVADFSLPYIPLRTMSAASAELGVERQHVSHHQELARLFCRLDHPLAGRGFDRDRLFDEDVLAGGEASSVTFSC